MLNNSGKDTERTGPDEICGNSSDIGRKDHENKTRWYHFLASSKAVWGKVIFVWFALLLKQVK